MEIVIENPSDTPSMVSPTANPDYGTPGTTHRSYRLAHNIDGTSPTTDYYGTLPPRGRSQHVPSPQLDFDLGSSTVRRVDKSGLLEIIEPEPTRRPRNLTGAENSGHTGTLTRRIDRSGLLEAVPEVPDQLQGQKSPELNTMRTGEESRGRSITERHLTGAEIDHKEQTLRASLSPRSLKSPIDVSNQEDSGNSTSNPTNVQCFQSSSPYFRRSQINPMPITDCNELSSMIGNVSTTSLESRGRQQPYVDLTGATYTRACTNSPLLISPRPTISGDLENMGERKASSECISRLSPRLRGDRQSPLAVSSIPDVIEAHGSSRVITRSSETEKEAPQGERAEAEGCEHTAIESLEETRVSFKAPNNKLLHNDNIQTLRVIILSEQL